MCVWVKGTGKEMMTLNPWPSVFPLSALYTQGSQLCLGLSVPHFPGGGIKKCRHLWEPLLESHCLRGSPGPRPAGF